MTVSSGTSLPISTFLIGGGAAKTAAAYVDGGGDVVESKVVDTGGVLSSASIAKTPTQPQLNST